jgi:hypothetical protein
MRNKDVAFCMNAPRIIRAWRRDETADEADTPQKSPVDPTYSSMAGRRGSAGFLTTGKKEKKF